MKSLSLLLFCLFLFSFANAQVLSDEDSTALELNEVIIVTSKFEDIKKNVPNQIDLISKEEIRLGNAQDAAYLLQATGKINVQRSQAGGGSPVIRGMEANRVLIVVDDVRMNNAIFRGGHLQNVLRVDQNILERAEIIFGPGSTVYGSDAMGGVMHFRTVRPMLSFVDTVKVNGSGMLRYGSVNNEMTGHADFNIGGKKWASLTSLTFSDFGDMHSGKSDNPFNKDYKDLFDRDEFVERINGQDSVVKNNDPSLQRFTGYSQMNALQKFRFSPASGINHYLNVHYSTSTDVPRYDRLTDRRNGNLRFAEWYYGPEEWLMTSYQFQTNRKDPKYDQAMFTAAYQSFKESRHIRNFGDDVRKSQEEAVSVFTANFDAQKGFKDNLLRYGFEASTNDVSSRAYTENITTGERGNSDTRYPNGGSTTISTSAYANNIWEIKKGIDIQGGMRYSFNALESSFIPDEFFPFPFKDAIQRSSALTGSAGVSASPSKTWKLSMLFATGYRVPNVDDVGKVFESTTAEDGEPGILIVPNPNLEPEYSYNSEIGITKSFSKKLILEVNGWYNMLRNLLTTGPGTYNGSSEVEYGDSISYVYQTINKDRAYITGFYAGFRYHPTKELLFSGSVNYTVGKIDSDTSWTPLDHIPPMFGRLAVSYRKGKANGEIYGLYNGEKKIEDYRLGTEDNERYATPEGMPAWYTVNIKGSYDLQKGMTVNAGVENLLDTKYRMFASGVNSAGRNVYVSLRASF
jgi:hemoglobin/transferrin/lactoferrin receptor protein